MGGKQSTEPECEEWREGEWEGVAGDRSFGRGRTLRNRRTGALVDEYQLSWPGEHEYCFYLKSFNWRNRRRNQAPVVASCFLREVCRGEGCSGKYAANVFLEHIPLRLSQIEDVPAADALFILVQALEGFFNLYQHSGYFRVSEDQICFDRAGRVKVWVNADLSKNFPECDSECGHQQRDEVDMVEQLVGIIAAASDPDDLPETSIEDYFDIVRKREVVQIGFEYAKIVAMEYARLYQIRMPNRFEAVIDLFANPEPKMYTRQASTLPSSQTITYHHPAPPPTYNYPANYPRLNTCYSMPNIPPNNPYQPPIHQAMRPQSSPYQYYPNNERQDRDDGRIPQIPRLSQLNYSQFGEPSVQTKRKSRNSKTSKNSKSQMVCHEQTTQNQSLHFNESHADQRNTMKSMPLRNPYATHRDRFGNSQRVRYSQCDQQIFSQTNQPEYRRPHHDAFGRPPPNRRMKDSSSSYRFGSSNSSQSKRPRRSKHSSSRRESVRDQRRDYERREQRPPEFRYFSSLAEQWQLDPEIQADIRKYFG